MISPGPQRLRRRPCPSPRGTVAALPSVLRLEQPARALQVIGDRRQRLVQLVRQRRGHLAHGGQPRDVHQLGLQFLQPGFGLLPLGQVADEAGEEAPVAGSHLADRQLHREGRAVLALADHDPADADDAPLAGAAVALEIAVMLSR